MKKLFVPYHFLFFLALFLALFLAPGILLAKARIVLDAGHGGTDSGVKAGSEVEKEWNLKFAQAIQRALEEEGYEVVQLRRGDTTLAEEKRAEMTNTAQASAALIIHADREWTGTLRGPYVVLEPPSKVEAGETNEIPKWGYISLAQYRSSLRLARAVAQRLGLGTDFSSLSDSRCLAGEVSTSEGRIYGLPHESLRYLVVPSIVISPLFLSSAADLKKYSGTENLTEFAQRVAKGTAEFLQSVP